MVVPLGPIEEPSTVMPCRSSSAIWSPRDSRPALMVTSSSRISVMDPPWDSASRPSSSSRAVMSLYQSESVSPMAWESSSTRRKR